jgi:hypothetical protein
MNPASPGGGGNRIRSPFAFDWRAFAARRLTLQRTPASIVVGRLIAEYFSDRGLFALREEKKRKAA